MNQVERVFCLTLNCGGQSTMIDLGKRLKKQHLEMCGIKPRTYDDALFIALAIELHAQFLFNLQYN